MSKRADFSRGKGKIQAATNRLDTFAVYNNKFTGCFPQSKNYIVYHHADDLHSALCISSAHNKGGPNKHCPNFASFKLF